MPSNYCNTCTVYSEIDNLGNCYSCACITTSVGFNKNINSFVVSHAKVLMKCPKCQKDVFLILKSQNCCIVCATAQNSQRATVSVTSCPSCGGPLLTGNKICNNCRRQGMDLCPVCNKYTRFHITMVNACQDCVQKALQLQNNTQQTLKQTINPSYGSTVGWNPSSYSSPTPINPKDSIFRDTKQTREEIYQLFHKKAERVLEYPAFSGEELKIPINMAILAILNEIFEELGYETIDTKFFKEM